MNKNPKIYRYLLQESEEDTNENIMRLIYDEDTHHPIGLERAVLGHHGTAFVQSMLFPAITWRYGRILPKPGQRFGYLDLNNGK